MPLSTAVICSIVISVTGFLIGQNSSRLQPDLCNNPADNILDVIACLISALLSVNGSISLNTRHWLSSLLSILVNNSLTVRPSLAANWKLNILAGQSSIFFLEHSSLHDQYRLTS